MPSPPPRFGQIRPGQSGSVWSTRAVIDRLRPPLARRLIGAETGDRRREPGPPQLWPLAVLAVLVMLLAAVGGLPRWPGLGQLVALPPLDLYADLRVLMTTTQSVPEFGALLVAVLALRVVVLALLLGGLTRARIGFAVRFYLILLPIMLLAATVNFASYAVLYSRMFWPALTLVVVVALIMAPAPWQPAATRAGTGPPPAGPAASWRLSAAVAGSVKDGLRLAVLIPYAVALIGIGALADLGGQWAAVALVPVSAVATALAIRFLARPAPARALLRLAAASMAALLVGAGFVATRTVEPAPPPPPRAGSLLLMSGINSSSGNGSIFEADVAGLGYDCDQVYYFSYAGPGDGAPQGDATCPIRTGEPYQPEDTMRPLAEQAEIFAAQVRELPGPVTVAGHSLGAWVAWQSVATGAAPEVDVLILVGPFPDSPAAFPPAGQSGVGKVGGDLIRALAPLAELVDFHFTPDAPASQELLATPNAAAEVYREPLPPDVRALSITSATDLPLMPGGWRLPVEHNACPVREAHPYLPETPAFYHEVNRFLDGEAGLPCPAWRDWGGPASRGFGVPPAAARGAPGRSTPAGSARRGFQPSRGG